MLLFFLGENTELITFNLQGYNLVQLFDIVKLVDFPDNYMNGEYIVISVKYDLSSNN